MVDYRLFICQLYGYLWNLLLELFCYCLKEFKFKINLIIRKV
jgi:hypothetical protein